MLILALLFSVPVYADVGDNLNGWLIDFLGYGKQDSVPSTYGGSLVERVNFLENENQFLKSQIASLGTKTDALGVKVNNLATKEDVENVSKAANASYNLYVYIPKNIATGNYDAEGYDNLCKWESELFSNFKGRWSKLLSYALLQFLRKLQTKF